MVRNTRSVCKTCPECDQQAAVASKTCSSCGFDFFKAKRQMDESLQSISSEPLLKPKRSATSTPIPDQKFNSKKLIAEETRRTTRIRREKPQFYDSRQYDKKPKRSERPKRSNKQLADLKDGLDTGNAIKESRMKKKLKSKDELIDDNINMMDRLPEEKQQYAEFLLAEINRKLIGVQWRPTD